MLQDCRAQAVDEKAAGSAKKSPASSRGKPKTRRSRSQPAQKENEA